MASTEFDEELLITQRELCNRVGSSFLPALPNQKIGIARNVRGGQLPINGLRHPPEGDTSGWYIWAGEDLRSDPEFFVPLHVAHVHDWCPAVLRYLGLAPGWRFLNAPGYEDIWFDEALLDV
jgi:hypothetical protein